MQSQHEKVVDLLKHFTTGMLITHKIGEGLHGRPMAVASVMDQSISFFTSFESPKVEEILSDPNVLVTFQKDNSLSVSVSGTALLTRDKARLAAHWKDSYKTWFPGGLEDPRLCLIDVYPGNIEYWDNSGLNKVKYLIEAAKAYVTGEKPQIKEGEQHGVVRAAAF